MVCPYHTLLSSQWAAVDQCWHTPETAQKSHPHSDHMRISYS